MRASSNDNWRNSMNKFIFTTHEILSVIRNVSLKDFNPTCLDGQQLNEMVSNSMRWSAILRIIALGY